MEVIIKPILTEKMTIQGEKLNRYGFIVDVRANITFNTFSAPSTITSADAFITS